MVPQIASENDYSIAIELKQNIEPTIKEELIIYVKCIFKKIIQRAS